MSDTDYSTVRVMIIDDEAFSRKFITHLLKAFGIEQVYTAVSGADALAQLKEPDTDIDLIICDIEMPEMDGYEATEEIRQREDDKKHTPIIALAATAMKEDRVRCLQVGMDDYLTKPVNLKALQKTLLRWSPPDDEVINIPIR